MNAERGVKIRASLGRPLVGAAVLLAIYVVISFATSPEGYLGTDTGAKVATLEKMVEQDTFRPTVGYWAEEWDPRGEYHPLIYTRPTDDGEWVNVTTLPMLLLARPLYDVGGYQLTLLLPMFGSIGAALACRDLARQLSDERSGEMAFWVVGLASPMFVYALDLWEHSAGAALMVAAVGALLRPVQGDLRIRWGLLAGVALGVSATMRTETFVFTLPAVGIVCLTILWRRQFSAAILTGLGAVAGFAVPWIGNSALENALGGNTRTARVSGAARQDTFNEFGERAKEAAVTWLGLPGFSYPGGVMIGGFVVLSLTGAVLMRRRGQERAATISLLVGVVMVVVTLAGAGLSFVPGALMASPVAIAAFWFHRLDSPRLTVLVVGIVATVGIWALQFVGGAGPQWGGRYILGPTLLLTTLGVIHLAGSAVEVRRAVVGLGLFVTLFGVAWVVHRSHEVDRFFDEIAQQPEDVVIVTNGFLVREAGSEFEERRYLSLSESAELEGAVEVVTDADLDTFAVLSSAADLPELDAAKTGMERMTFLGAPFWYHRFELE